MPRIARAMPRIALATHASLWRRTRRSGEACPTLATHAWPWPLAGVVACRPLVECLARKIPVLVKQSCESFFEFLFVRAGSPTIAQTNEFFWRRRVVSVLAYPLHVIGRHAVIAEPD